MKTNKLSLLFPDQDRVTYRMIPEETWHDLGLDAVTEKVALLPQEAPMIEQVMRGLTDDPSVTEFRCGVFEDILRHPEIRERMAKLLERVKSFYDYGVVRKHHGDESGVWDLMHRMEEYHDYIVTVEEIRECLSEKDLQSEGMLRLRAAVEEIYRDNGFAALRKDVEEMRLAASSVKSMTVGINLNDRFEAVSLGLVSVNAKPFTRSGLLKNFLTAGGGMEQKLFLLPRQRGNRVHGKRRAGRRVGRGPPQSAGEAVPGPGVGRRRDRFRSAADGQRRHPAGVPDYPEAAGDPGEVPECQREGNRGPDPGADLLYPVGGIY